MSDVDVLAALDWPATEIRCQCENELCPNGCPNRATRRVEFHSIDDCNRPDLGTLGNLVMLLCDTCLDTLG